MEKLFDSLITPILLYCCEVWGLFCKLYDSESFEKLNMKFIKEILGTHCKSMNVACRAELGRLLLKTKNHFLMLQILGPYYFR